RAHGEGRRGATALRPGLAPDGPRRRGLRRRRIVSDVVLIDTSVFCEILAVPGLASRPREILDQLEAGADEAWTYLLPWATVLETGNHVGQVSDGRLRRAVAERFVEAVRRSLD